MKTQNFGPLYAKASTGKVKTWKITVVLENNGEVKLNTLHGYENGKLSSSTKAIKGKNTGRKNETTPWNQALSDARSKVNKKIDEGYVYDKAELEGQTLLLPMLAHSYTKRKHDIIWPAYLQPKLNGVRCLSRMTADGPEYISRKGKKYDTLGHLNKEVEELICKLQAPLDGEVFVHQWTFQEIVRAVKKERDYTLQLEYWVYDLVAPDLTFEERITKLSDYFVTSNGYFNPNQLIRKNNIVLVPTYEVTSEAEMMSKHKEFVDLGYEGTIVRNKKGLYILKNRSKDLQKYKDFIDEEFVIVGGKEATGNDKGTVIFECRTKEGKIFAVRPKGSRELRGEWLKDIDRIVGKNLTVKYQELSEDNVPIFPVGVTVRDYE